MSLLSNISLIGMPGSGKSTVGKMLAKHFSMQFLDGDALIEQATNMPIQQVVNRMGLKRFNQVEQQVLCQLDLNNTVISTGGSAVYSRSAMMHLGNISTRLYLRISRNTLLRRVNNQSARGLSKLPAHTLLRLFHERESIYPEFADVVFDNDLPLTSVRADQLISLLADR